MGSPCLNQDKIHFDSRLMGSASNVSENTRFRHQRHPILQKKNGSINNNIQNSLLYDDIHPTLSTTSTINTPSVTTSFDLPIITETTPHESSVNNADPVLSTLKELQLDPSIFSVPKLSSTQITEITTAVINHLKKHGKVTLELINFIRDGYSSPKNTTSTTPTDRPTLLSSN